MQSETKTVELSNVVMTVTSVAVGMDMENGSADSRDNSNGSFWDEDDKQ